MRKSSLLQWLNFLFLCQLVLAMSGFQGGPKVAIIGGGISGLSCARRLQALGIVSTVFDTGKKATGGRCSSRAMKVEGKTYIADHSSQFFTASSERFKKDLESLRSDGSVFDWRGDLVHITEPSMKVAKIPIVKDRLVCKNGMETFSRKMSEKLEIRRPVWVSKMEKCRVNPDKWKIYQYDELLGSFDAVVIAHNGKCADRLLSTTDVPRIHNLLKVNFGDRLPPPNQMKKMQLCSLWVTVFAVKGSLPIDFEGAYVSQGNTLSWMSNNTKKMRPPAVTAAIAAPAPAPVTTADSFPALSSKAVASKQTPAPAKFSYAAAASSLSATATTPPVKQSQLREGVSPVSGKEGGGRGKGDEEIECWTLTSTREFGAANKVPQENVPPEKEREIISAMLRAMERVTGLKTGSIVPIASKAQLWGAAVPMNRHTAPFLIDGPQAVAVCGDWFTPSSTSLGPSIESAYLSGSLLADSLADRFNSGIKKDYGLDPKERFQACAGHPLGDVPSIATGTSTTEGVKGPGLQAPTQSQSQSQPNSGPKRVWIPKSTTTTKTG